MKRSAICVLTAGLVLAAATPASADTGPNLAMTAVVGQGRWLPGDTVPIDLTITNSGDAAATDVWATTFRQSGPYLSIPPEAWSELQYSGKHTTFAPGETRTYHLPATVSYSDEGDPVVEFIVFDAEDVDSADNRTTVTVPLVPADTVDRVAGHVYGDRDRDGKPSPGEDLAGAEAHLIGTGMTHDLVAVTDAAGRFAFDGLRVGTGYSLHFEKVPDNWQLPYLPPLRLDGSGANTALEVQGTRPLSESLAAAIVLNKAKYAVGETAKATVTLTNTGDRPLTGLFAGCDPGGFGRQIEVPNAQWGAFDPEHPAGQLAPGQRVVLKVSGKVPALSAYFGVTGLDCFFDDGKTPGGPYVVAKAKVPGMKADAKVQVWVDKNHNGQPDAGEGLAKTKVVLTEDGGHPVSLTQTDADGFATFPQVGVGDYRLRVLGAWTTVGEAGVSVIAPPYGYGDWSVQVAPR